MKFIVQRNDLLDVLSVTGKAIGKSAFPILDNYRLFLSANLCIVTGSNMENFISKSCPVISEIPELDICINAKKLLDLIKGLSDQPLTFDVTITKSEIPKADDIVKVKISASNGGYDLAAELGKDYPVTPKVEDKVTYILKSDRLVEAIDKTLFAIDPNIPKEGFKYVLIDSGNGISLVGCDVQIMAVNRISDNTVNINKSLASKGSFEMFKSINPKGELEISYGDRNILFSLADGTVITIQLLDEKYADYKSIIPKSDKVLIVNTSDFISALKRLSLFGWVCLIELEGGKMNVSTENYDYNESAKETVFCDYSDLPFRIKLNIKNTIDVLSKVKSNAVKIKFLEKNNAVVLMDSKAEDNNNIFLIMPVLLID